MRALCNRGWADRSERFKRLSDTKNARTSQPPLPHTTLTLPGRSRPKLVYTIPIHQNPTGATLPEARRVQLLQLAHHYGFHVVADEVYQVRPLLASACLPACPHA